MEGICTVLLSLFWGHVVWLGYRKHWVSHHIILHDAQGPLWLEYHFMVYKDTLLT